MIDPTTDASETQIAERDHLRVENARLSKALVEAYTQVEGVKAERDRLPPTEIFVLLTDSDGTLRSSDEPFGVAVTTEEEAKCFVREGGLGYTHSYTHSYVKVFVFADKDEGICQAYPSYKPRKEAP